MEKLYAIVSKGEMPFLIFRWTDDRVEAIEVAKAIKGFVLALDAERICDYQEGSGASPTVS